MAAPRSRARALGYRVAVEVRPASVAVEGMAGRGPDWAGSKGG